VGGPGHRPNPPVASDNTLSEFHGATITVPSSEALSPRFTVAFDGYTATFETETLQVLNGWIPARIRRLTDEWATRHREELLANWDKASSDGEPLRIDPLD